MSFSMYDASVPVFRQGLTALAGILDKAAAYCETRKIDPAVLIRDRLFGDMHPFQFQVEQLLNHSVGAVQRLAGGDPPRASGLDSFEAMKSAVAAAIAALDATTPAELEGSDVRDVQWMTGQGPIRFLGKGYLRSFSLQNFFFHLTTAYNILRHNGLEIGKRDFMGPSERLA